ncbi:hypothetical protein EVAR_14062_1 [Eumeta japonica]|uniref:Uncharacterized protein n=1 Tax=Eumeta variegata TaxID=151549 RepID=A0A4C1UN55_EUMVA|nr:hypothetical protein EVAR_14062_1 [Eumeta japonica]
MAKMSWTSTKRGKNELIERLDNHISHGIRIGILQWTFHRLNLKVNIQICGGLGVMLPAARDSEKESGEGHPELIGAAHRTEGGAGRGALRIAVISHIT